MKKEIRDQIAKLGINPDDITSSSDLMKSLAGKDHRLNELCKCITKTPEWKYHEQYCPIWKNGRIEELERILIAFDSAFMSEDIHDLGKVHEATVKALKIE